MVIDNGLGTSMLSDILTIAGEHIDHWKFGFGTSALMSLRVLEEKLVLLHEQEILTYPGGTLLEAAIVQTHCRVFIRRAKELGFGAVEISEGTIDLPPDRRRRIIDYAREAGLIAITEAGRKDPKRQPTAAELAEQALKDLAWGASWVVIEGRECGQGIGIYDRKGEILNQVLDEIVTLAGDAAPRLIWEAPLRHQQSYLICRFGSNVSLGNIQPQDCLALEALRCGLRFETFSAVAAHSREAGQWDPARIEDASSVPLSGGGR
jgi:phosphosulfolactate synthase